MSDNKHKLMLEERAALMLNGVQNVDSFDESHIELSGSFGGLDIEGDELKIASLDLDAGKISISGRIDALVYGQAREEKKCATGAKRRFRTF